MLALLADPGFAPFFAAQFFGAANDNVYKNALVVLIAYRIAGEGSALLVTFAAGLFILPFFLFSATAGRLADGVDKARLVRATKAMEIPIMVLGGAGFVYRQEGLLLTVLFLMGTQSSVFGPVKYAILPALVHERDLVGANALVEGGTFLAILLGTITGGLLILVPGGEVLVAACVCLLAVLGWGAARRVPAVPAAAPGLRISANIFLETARVIGHARANPHIYAHMLAISWFWLLGATFLAQFPNLARGPLHARGETVTLLLALFTVGIAIGSALCARVLKGRISLSPLPLSTLAISVFMCDLYLAVPHSPMVDTPLYDVFALVSKPWAWRVMADLTLIALSGGFYVVPLYASIQKQSAPEHRSRNIAALNVLNAVFMVLSAVIGAGLLALGGTVSGLFLTLGIANLGVFLWTRKLARPVSRGT